MNNKATNYVGPSFFTLLGVLFIGLKLVGTIDWPWWVVLAPIWGPLVLAIVFIVLYVAYAKLS